MMYLLTGYERAYKLRPQIMTELYILTINKATDNAVMHISGL